jgi:glyoxylate/hydroxypyruvate reductase A
VNVGPILVYYPDPAELDAYARLVRAPRDTTVNTAATPGDASRFIGTAEILYAWGFPHRLLAEAPRLRWVQAMGAGVERFLVPELPSGVRLTRAPVFGPWMVEYVFGWWTWLTQRMATYREAQRDHRWITVFPERLRGKTMALVGLGDIGRSLARAAATFGVRVVGVSRTGRRVPRVDRVYRPGGLRRALADADLVVLALPLTRETRGLIGTPELDAMRPDAWLLNIARGPIVQEPALLQALRDRRIAGAILDVFDAEPLPPSHPLWDLPNVVITPHIAGPSTPEEITRVFNENLRRYTGSRRLLHVVDRRRSY